MAHLSLAGSRESHPHNKQVYIAGLKAFLVRSINMMQCSPLPCALPTLKAAFTLPKGYSCRGDKLPFQLMLACNRKANLRLSGLVARIAVSLRESPEWHETHWSFLLWRRFPLHAPLPEPVHCSTLQQREPGGGGRGSWSQGEESCTSNFWSWSSSVVCNFHTQVSLV